MSQVQRSRNEYKSVRCLNDVAYDSWTVVVAIFAAVIVVAPDVDLVKEANWFLLGSLLANTEIMYVFWGSW